MAEHYIEVYRERGVFRRWRWRRKAGNHRIVETAGQGFTRKSSAVRSAQDAHPGEEIREP